MRKFIFGAVVVSALALASSALADGPPPGAIPLNVVQEKSVPAKGEGVIENPEGGGTVGGAGCWYTTWSVGRDTATGSYRLYFRPRWCGNGYVITGFGADAWPYVSMWYQWDGLDGIFTDGGCVGCQYLVVRAQGRFSWHPPFYAASHNTAWLSIWLTPAGQAYVYGYNE